MQTGTFDDSEDAEAVTSSPARRGGTGIDARVGLSLVPVLVFWTVRRAGFTELAIAAGFVSSLVVFGANRRRGVIGALAIMSITVAGGAAIVGLVLRSEKAYLANDAAGDFLMVAIAAGSLAIRRPLLGLIARELVPQLRSVLAVDHRVFIGTTVLMVGMNAFQGIARVLLLSNLTVDEYLVWSRAVSWPFSIGLVIVAFTLIRRAARHSVEPRGLRGEAGT